MRNFTYYFVYFNQSRPEGQRKNVRGEKRGYGEFVPVLSRFYPRTWSCYFVLCAFFAQKWCFSPLSAFHGVKKHLDKHARCSAAVSLLIGIDVDIPREVTAADKPDFIAELTAP